MTDHDKADPRVISATRGGEYLEPPSQVHCLFGRLCGDLGLLSGECAEMKGGSSVDLLLSPTSRHLIFPTLSPQNGNPPPLPHIVIDFHNLGRARAPDVAEAQVESGDARDECASARHRRIPQPFSVHASCRQQQQRERQQGREVAPCASFPVEPSGQDIPDE